MATPHKTLPKTPEKILARQTASRVSWTLLIGGVLFFVGGMLHPKEDPPGVSLKEHMRVMFEDPLWYPAHAVIFAGMALIAAAFVGLVRGRSLSGVPRIHRATLVAAITASLAAAGMLLHLVSVVEGDRIAAGQSTPIIDMLVIVESTTVPAFCAAVVALAVLGAMTRTLGNVVIAVPGVLGGIGFGLASGTFLLTDALDPLFPTAAGIALWAIGVAAGLLRRRRAADPQYEPAVPR